MKLLKPAANQLALTPKLDIRILAVLVSLVFSLIYYLKQGVINPDGILYLQVAQALVEQGLKPALQLYNWPFYSILIAGLHQLTGLSFYTAAYLINALLIALIVYAFITLVKELGANRSVCLLAALLVLLNPSLNSLKRYIIRDFGFWAFGLWALVQLLRFNNSHGWQHGVGWLLSSVLAILFRVEGLIFFVLAPWGMLFNTRLPFKDRCWLLLKLNALPLVMAIIAIVAVFFSPLVAEFRLSSSIQHWWISLTNLVTDFHSQALAVSHLISNGFADTYANLMLIAALMAILVAAFFANLSTLYAIALCAALYKSFQQPVKLLPGVKGSFWLFALAILLTLLAFVFAQRFMAERYTMLLGLVLLAVAAFPLASWFDLEKLAHWNLRKSLLSIALVVILLVQGFISFGYSKDYIDQGADWINENTPAQARIFTNNTSLAYFIKRNTNDYQQMRSINDKQILAAARQPGYDYLVVVIKHRDADLLKQLEALPQLTLVQTLTNKRGDGSFIFKVKTKG